MLPPLWCWWTHFMAIRALFFREKPNINSAEHPTDQIESHMRTEANQHRHQPSTDVDRTLRITFRYRKIHHLWSLCFSRCDSLLLMLGSNVEWCRVFLVVSRLFSLFKYEHFGLKQLEHVLIIQRTKKDYNIQAFGIAEWSDAFSTRHDETRDDHTAFRFLNS